MPELIEAWRKAKRMKISEYIASQCGNPRGVIGRIMTWSMNRANNVMYKGIVSELNIRDSLRILDIGFGNGYLEKLIMKKGKCNIEGIDISEDMVNAATNNNRKYVEDGYIKFGIGDCCSMDYEDESFDVVTTMNTIYFWNQTDKGMSEIFRVLKPGGVFYNASLTKENLDKVFYTKSGFKKFNEDEYKKLGINAGFTKVDIKPLGNKYGLLVICEKGLE